MNKLTEEIQLVDFEAIVRTGSSERAMIHALQSVTHGPGILRVLARYAAFNSVFVNGVVNLSAMIGVRQALFQDPSAGSKLTADRSAEIAAKVFAAAIDEFADRGIGGVGEPRTHRDLAHVALEAAATYFRSHPSELDAAINGVVREAISQVLDGYGASQAPLAVDEPKLFRTMGFHAASEMLAREEFRVLDSFLRERYPCLVKFMETARLRPEDDSGPYYWIRIHTIVEARHFELAVEAINLALRYYVGIEALAQVKGWILEGFRQFVALQAEFLERLAQD